MVYMVGRLGCLICTCLNKYSRAILFGVSTNSHTFWLLTIFLTPYHVNFVPFSTYGIFFCHKNCTFLLNCDMVTSNGLSKVKMKKRKVFSPTFINLKKMILICQSLHTMNYYYIKLVLVFHNFFFLL